jgi:hypothetical protein
MKIMKSLFIAVLGIVFSVSALAQGGSTRGSQTLSNASAASVAASGFVVAGSSELIQTSANLTVTAIQAAGESVVIVMRGTSEAVTVSVRTSAAIARDASVAVGSAVRVVAESVGHALYVGMKLVAFVPNEIGRSLIHHAVRDGSAR